MNNAIFICALHGDETAPLLALIEEGLSPLVGNPLAVLKRKRFVEQDLNASFGLSGDSLEERRARELLEKIPADKLVLDFHTFSCESEPFAIIVREEDLELAKRTGIKRIVLFRYDLKGGHALLHHRRGVAVETGKHDTAEAFETARQIARHFTSGALRSEVELFEVFGVETSPGEYRNFHRHPAGYIPMLAGEKAYPFAALKARKVAVQDG